MASKLSSGNLLDKDGNEHYNNYNLLNSPNNYFEGSSKNLGHARVIVKNPKQFSSFEKSQNMSQTLENRTKMAKEGMSIAIQEEHGQVHNNASRFSTKSKES